DRNVTGVQTCALPICTLIENASHVAVTFRGAVALGYPCALFVSRARSHPRRELLGGRKGCCRCTHLGNDLLCRIDTQAWHFRQRSEERRVGKEGRSQW